VVDWDFDSCFRSPPGQLVGLWQLRKASKGIHIWADRQRGKKHPSCRYHPCSERWLLCPRLLRDVCPDWAVISRSAPSSAALTSPTNVQRIA